MNDSPIIEAGRRWVIDNYPYNSHHLLRSLDWIDRLAPGSPDTVRLATLTHDMERAFPGPDQPINSKLNDPAYDKLHAERSARIVGAWLRDLGEPDDFVRLVADLVRAHEVGGWDDANLVQAADSLSFLETNVELFLGFIRSGRFPAEDVGIKFERSYERIQVPHARPLCLPLLAEARRRLAEELRGTAPRP